MLHVRSARTRVLGAAAAAALAATLSACGSNDSQAAADSSPSPDTTTSTAADPSPSPSSSLASQQPQQLDDGGQIAPADFVKKLKDGLAKTKYAHIEFTMSGTGGEISGQGDTDYTVKPANMSITMSVGPQSLGMVLVDKVIYIQNSAAGNKYLKYALDDPNNPLGSQLAAQLDPAGSIEMFVQAVKSVSSVGDEDVDGRTLHRYDLVIDTTKLADQSTAAGLPAEVPVTIWLDDEGRMGKSSMGLGPVQYVATLTDFDKQVDIQAPPKDQILPPPTATPSPTG